MAVVSPLYQMPSCSISQVQKMQLVANGPQPTFKPLAANGRNVPRVAIHFDETFSPKPEAIG
jgi:hypothetical protein